MEALLHPSGSGPCVSEEQVALGTGAQLLGQSMVGRRRGQASDVPGVLPTVLPGWAEGLSFRKGVVKGHPQDPLLPIRLPPPGLWALGSGRGRSSARCPGRGERNNKGRGFSSPSWPLF